MDNVGGLTKLLDYGLLGVLLSLSIGAIIYLFKLNQEKQREVEKEKDQRFQDMKEINSHVILTLDNFNDTVKTVFIEKTHEKKANE